MQLVAHMQSRLYSPRELRAPSDQSVCISEASGWHSCIQLFLRVMRDVMALVERDFQRIRREESRRSRNVTGFLIASAWKRGI